MASKKQKESISAVQELINLTAADFQKAQEQPKKQPEPTPDDRVKAYGIGLKISEWQHIEEIAEELGTTRHGVALWALKDFIRRYDAGEIQTKTQKALPGI